jgi:hypothetical protein
VVSDRNLSTTETMSARSLSSVPNINDIIADSSITEEDIDPTLTQQVKLYHYRSCENVIHGFLWNEHFQNKLMTSESGDEQQCYYFYSLNSFTHKKINFVCSSCFDIAKFVWFNVIPNAFSLSHHCHSSHIINCDKCNKLCTATAYPCNYFSFVNDIVTENDAANNEANCSSYCFDEF